jgi:dolichol-phosphate mannosyltransferase
MGMSTRSSEPEVSVILPVFNEAECIAFVVEELVSVLTASLPVTFEIVAVDDGSSDDTLERMNGLRARFPQVRVLRHSANVGQSFAFCTGFHAARGKIIVTFDADGQNDPADIPVVVGRIGPACDCCCGYRADRQDTRSRRLAGRFSNMIRNSVLHEDIIDTGCSTKAFRAEYVKNLQPWNGLHRFLGSFVAMRGGRIEQVPVHHRNRHAGASKYTNWKRLQKTVVDLFGVKWLKARVRIYTAEDVQ